MPAYDLTDTLGAAFFGFVLGTILFGITVLQVYQYFSNYPKDKWTEKLAVTVLFLLDTAHLVFAIHMVYFYLLKNFGDPRALNHAIWSLKGLGIAQVSVIWLVQGLYLARIWKLTGSTLPSKRMAHTLFTGIIVTGIIALAVGTLFIVKLVQIKNIMSPPGFDWVIYLGFGVSAFIDCVIALAMSFLLHRSITGIKRTDSIISILIQYFISTGLLTSMAAIVYIVLYAAKPHTLLYLGMEFAITRLYANSYLALCNARHWLRGEIEGPYPANVSTALRFSKQQGNSNHASPGPMPASWSSCSGEASRAQQTADVELAEHSTSEEAQSPVTTEL